MDFGQHGMGGAGGNLSPSVGMLESETETDETFKLKEEKKERIITTTYQMVSTEGAIGLNPHQSFLTLQYLQFIFGWIDPYRAGVCIIYWGWRVLTTTMATFYHQYFNFVCTQRGLESNILPYTRGMHSDSIMSKKIKGKKKTSNIWLKLGQVQRADIKLKEILQGIFFRK